MKATFAGSGHWPTSAKAKRVTTGDIRAFQAEDPKAFADQVALAGMNVDMMQFAIEHLGMTITPGMTANSIRAETFRAIAAFGRELHAALTPAPEVTDE